MVAHFFKKLDGSIILIILAFCIISVFSIHSLQQTGQFGSSSLGLKQGINYIIGAILLLIFAYLDLDQIELLVWPLYIITFGAVLILPFMPASIAPSILGAKRWYTVPLFGSLQPSEFLKVAIIMINAHITFKHKTNYLNSTVKSDLLLIGKILLVTLPPALVVYIEPDTGMPILYLAASAIILLMAGLQKRIILPLTIIPILIIAVLVYLYYHDPSIIFHKLIPLLSPHQQARILGWLSPNGHGAQAYQTDRSLLAIGNGQLFGTGISTANNIYIPEENTDFIFAYIAKIGGFLGASIVMTLFFLLIYKMVSTALVSENDFGALICAGAVILFSLQIFQNVGMTVGLMPVKGISLPFLSYGGSSIFSNMMIIGTMLSIRKNYRKYMFSIND